MPALAGQRIFTVGGTSMAWEDLVLAGCLCGHRDLRRQIGFVLQENHLFDDTIARNIAFGEDEPTWTG